MQIQFSCDAFYFSVFTLFDNRDLPSLEVAPVTHAARASIGASFPGNPHNAASAPLKADRRLGWTPELGSVINGDDMGKLCSTHVGARSLLHHHWIVLPSDPITIELMKLYDVIVRNGVLFFARATAHALIRNVWWCRYVHYERKVNGIANLISGWKTRERVSSVLLPMACGLISNVSSAKSCHSCNTVAMPGSSWPLSSILCTKQYLCLAVIWNE